MTLGLLLVLLLICLSFPSWRRRWQLWRWRRQLDADKQFTHWQELFVDVDGFRLSKACRTHSDAFDYVYGEITFFSFIALLSLVKPTADTVFYDLGSGVGKAVFACAMVFKVKKSCGIELFTGLHDAALAVKTNMQVQDLVTAKNIHFINNDFMQADFSDADLIFINATGFIGETWQRLNQRLAETCSATIITTSKKLSAQYFTVTHSTLAEMSWGIVKAFVQQSKSSYSPAIKASKLGTLIK